MSEIIRFQSIDNTVKLQLGVSKHFLREGVKDGWIPHIKAGSKVLINVPKLIEILDEKSVDGNCR